MLQAVNLARALATFEEPFQPRTVATFNGCDVMVVKVQGAFDWHRHADTDDFFLVLEGRLRMDTEAGPVELGPGEIFVVPRGLCHRPFAEGECHVLLIEPTGTPNTGDARTAQPRRLA